MRGIKIKTVRFLRQAQDARVILEPFVVSLSNHNGIRSSNQISVKILR